MTEEGLSIGAVDFIFKYTPNAQIPKSTLRKELIAKVKSAARVKVIRTIPSRLKKYEGIGQRSEIRGDGSEAKNQTTPSPELITSYPSHNSERIVVVGASTGGPLALKEMLSFLDTGFDFPIVIVQHMPERFTAILASQFERIFPFPVKEAAQRDFLVPGMVLISPGNRHLLIESDHSVRISNAPEVNGHRPSIDVTMQSAAQVFGSQCVGIILSGMGHDGTLGLLSIYQNAGMTFAQSSATCVVDSMPVSAVKKGIVHHIGSPAEIGGWLTEKIIRKGMPKTKGKP